MKGTCFIIFFIIMASLPAIPLHANTMEFMLNESNALPDSTNYAKVSLSYIYDGAKRGVTITVQANDSILQPGSNFGIQRFGFNTTIQNPNENLIIKLPPLWNRKFAIMRPAFGFFGWIQAFFFNYSAFGRFEIDTRTTGRGRVNPLYLEIFHATDDLSFSDFVVANSEDWVFATHIADFAFENSSLSSAYFCCPNNPVTTTTTSAAITTTVKPSTTTTVKPTSTTTVKPTTTTTVKPTSTTTIKPTTTTTIQPTSTTTIKPTTTSSTIPVTTTAVSSTTSSLPVTTSTIPTTTTSLPTSTSSSSSTTSSLPVTTSTIPTTTTTPPTSTSSSSTTTTTEGSCTIEIARGSTCPESEEIDDPAFNRPGRRGLAATCNDIIDFTVCTDCDPFDPACLEWTIEPAMGFLTITRIDDLCWRLTVGDSCDQLEKIEEYEITVTDTCNNVSDSVCIQIGKVIVEIGDTTIPPDTESAAVDIQLINPEHYVRAMVMNICECGGGEDELVCTECFADPDRARNFTCIAQEQGDGCCRVLLYSTNPSSLIVQGREPVARVFYEAGDAEVGSCVCLTPVATQISDQFNEELCACQLPGEVCFRTCGDIYPQDCLGNPSCGDGVVDLFDILEIIDILLGYQTATACQIGNGDVPNGIPPYCGNPAGTPNCEGNGILDIFDALVIIDKALGKANCCDYCLFGEIY